MSSWIVTVESTDDEDSYESGAGARLVSVVGATQDHKTLRLLARLDGTSPVLVGGPFIEIKDIQVKETGTAGHPCGRLTVRGPGRDGCRGPVLFEK